MSHSETHSDEHQPFSFEDQAGLPPPPPFLVPVYKWATLYQADVTIAEGEADPLLALKAADVSTSSTVDKRFKPSKTIVLSEDSDMVMYDLGDAFLVPPSTIEELPCRMCGGNHTILKATMFHQASFLRSNVSPRLNNLSDSGDAAYYYWLKTIFLWRQQRRKGRGRDLRSLWLSVHNGQFDQDFQQNRTLRAFETFSGRYFPNPAKLGANDLSRGQVVLNYHDHWRHHLDVRVSELAFQFRESTEKRPNEFRMYLPVLFDDPDQNTAWSLSRSIRTLAYRVLAANFPAQCSEVREYFRSGYGLGSFRIDIRDQDSACFNAELWHLHHCFEKVQAYMCTSSSRSGRSGSFRTQESYQIHNDYQAWHGLALVLSYFWCLENDMLPPRSTDNINEDLFVWPGESIGCLEWTNVHLNAMCQGVMYSLYMLRQALNVPQHILRGDKTIVDDTKRMDNLHFMETVCPLQVWPSRPWNCCFPALGRFDDFPCIIGHRNHTLGDLIITHEEFDAIVDDLREIPLPSHLSGDGLSYFCDNSEKPNYNDKTYEGSSRAKDRKTNDDAEELHANGPSFSAFREGEVQGNSDDEDISEYDQDIQEGKSFHSYNEFEENDQEGYDEEGEYNEYASSVSGNRFAALSRQY